MKTESTRKMHAGGVRRPGRAMEWSEERIARLREMVDSGASLSVMAKELGCCAVTVSNWAAKFGIVTRGRKTQWNADAMARLETLFAEGKSDEEIAREIGVTASAVLTQRCRKGLKKNHWMHGGGVRKDVTVRPCITCRQPFGSEGKHNRMCPDCRESANDAGFAECSVAA